MSPFPLLDLKNISVIRAGRKALDNVSLTIEQGENVAILGPNGCGKSTLVKLIDRELYPVAGSGSMRILGRDRWDISELRSSLGIVTNDLQNAIAEDVTALDVVIAGFTGKLGVYYDDASEERIALATAALTAAHADHLKDRVFHSLSSGEARRVLIARSLAHAPSTLLLDEPTTSLDVVSAYHLLRTLRCLTESGKSLLLVTHHFSEIIPEIDRVVLLKNGRILADGPREMVMTSANLSELFETRVHLSAPPYQIEIIES